MDKKSFLAHDYFCILLIPEFNNDDALLTVHQLAHQYELFWSKINHFITIFPFLESGCPFDDTLATLILQTISVNLAPMFIGHPNTVLYYMDILVYWISIQKNLNLKTKNMKFAF